MSIISERLKQLRKEKGVTQKAVADHIGIAGFSYQRFEYGTGRPSLDTAIELADYFDVSIDYLVGRSDSRGGL